MDEAEIKRQREATEAEIGDALTRAADLTSYTEEVEDVNADDIKINDNDLALLDGEDDIDLEKAFGEGDLNEEDAALLAELDNFGEGEFGTDNDDDDGYDAIDMDDPKALEKLEAAEKARKERKTGGSKRTNTKAKKEDKTELDPTAHKKEKVEKAEVTTKSSRTAEKTKDTQAKTKSVPPQISQTQVRAQHTTSTKKPAGPSAIPPLSPAVLKERRASYDRIEKLLRQNLEDLSSQMKLLLMDKTEESTARAQKYLKIKQSRQKDLEYLLQQSSIDADVPLYKTMSVKLSMEQRDTSIELDQIIVTLRAMTVPKDFKGHLEVELELGAGLQGMSTTFSGKKFIEINQDLTFPLPKNCRQLQSFIRPIRVAKLKISAHSKSLFWTSCLGQGELKLNPLLTEISTAGEVRIRGDGNKNVGDVEVLVRLSRPFTGKKILTETKDLIIIDRTTTMQQVHAEENAAFNRLQQNVPQDEENDDERLEKGVKSEKRLKPQQLQTASASKATTPTASSSKVESTSTAVIAPETVVVPQTGNALLRYLKCPETTTWDHIKLADSPSVMFSFDALGVEKAACEAKLATASPKEKTTLLERIEECGHRSTLFEVMVGNGAMTFDMYTTNLKDGIEREKNTLKSLILLAKHFLAVKDPEAAGEYKQSATWLSKMIKVMEVELKNAEENRDELEEE